MIRTGRLLLLIGALALFPACADEGGDEDADDETTETSEASDELTPEEQEYADAFAATLADDTNGFAVPADDAACMGDAVMAELGVEPFEAADVEPDDIQADGESAPGELLGDGAVTSEQAFAIIDVWEDCTDLVEMLAESGGSELDLDPEGKECFAAGLAKDDLAAGMLAGSFTSEDGTPDDDTVQAFLALLDACSQGTENPLVASIAEGLAEDGSLTAEQSQCLAEGVVDEIGSDRLGELFATGGFEELPPELQAEVTGALIHAAGACDVPLSAFG